MKKKKTIKKKKDEKKNQEHLVVEHNAQDRIASELAHQLESYLPIASFAKLMEKLDEVVVDKHRLPLKIFAPHISNDLFPIEIIEDLEQKLSDGIGRSVSLAHSGLIPVRNKLCTDILATTFQEQKGNVGNLMPRVPARNIYCPASASASGSTAEKGGKS